MLHPRYAFDLAHDADDAQIRELLRTNPVPGPIELSYEREPDYFAGSSIMGPICQTLVARCEGLHVVGLATRSLRPLYVNGEAQMVGYIGQLRIAPDHRGRWLLPQGFRLFYRLHQDGAARGYITTIVEGNQEAEGLLVTRARRHFPRYRRLNRIVTLAILLHRRLPQRRSSLSVMPAEPGDLEVVARFLNRVGRRRQFFPVLSASDLSGDRTRGLSPADILVARRAGNVVGVLSLWDQRAFKQTRVRKYATTIHRMRPLFNLLSPVTGAAPLPDIGGTIPSCQAAFICIEDDDPTIFDNLLRYGEERARQQGIGVLAVGLCEDDPLLPVVRRRPHISYYSTLYSVCWPGDESWHDSLDKRPTYVEIATL